MIIRLAVFAEAEKIADLLQESFKEYEPLYTQEGYASTTPNRNEIANRINEGTVWVACDGKEILGTVSAIPKERALYIRSMAVSPNARKRGIGESLLRHVEIFGRSRGFDRLLLSTTSFLLSAIRLYEKFGYHRADYGPDELFGTPLFTMEKILQEETKMTAQKDRAVVFQNLHVKGDPLVLFNIWDPGSAKALQEIGAKAIATGSWSVAAAHGYNDGEKIPLELVEANAKRIVEAVDLPVTIDFESGYGRSPANLKVSVRKIIQAGAVGINFEDQIIGGTGLYSIEDQAARIRAIRETAEEEGIPLFINARTDVFLKAPPDKQNESHLEEAVKRSSAYAEAGGSGLFAPGLRNPEWIRKLCEFSRLPVNILQHPDAPPAKHLAELGVARISYGPFPYRQMIAALKEAARQAIT